MHHHYKHILLVSAIYPPEPVVSAQTSAQVAEAIRSKGHTVTVITSFPNRPAGKIFPGYKRRFVQRERTTSGIEIVRCFATLSPESRMFSRVLENLTFGITSGWQVLTGRKPDIIYANTWPIVATGILFLIAWLRRIPVVLTVQDVYPEVLVVQQRISDTSILACFLRWIDGLIARNSAHVIVISEQFAEIYKNQRKVQVGQLSLVPNWIEDSHIDVSISRQRYRQKNNIDNSDFLVVYGGNVGVAAGVENVIASMHALTEEPHIRLLVAGSGSQLAICQNLAQSLIGHTVLFHSPWATEETSEVLRCADLLVLPTSREQSLVSVPSKLLAYMLCGRPVLATAVEGSELANLIKLAQCGWVVEPDRPDLLMVQIKKIVAMDAHEQQQFGENGRAYVLRHFTREVCLPEVVRILEVIKS